MSYQLSTLKAALTRAERSGDPHKVLAEANRALDLFMDEGYPDCWHRWETAVMDAQLALNYRRPYR